VPPTDNWYQRAVFYEVSVRGFFDADNDGTGDLRGLIAKLGYLEWLGVDCLWLLPFYGSPLRDGGYDVSDFLSVLPELGALTDAIELVEEVHRRGMRLVADLVVNHTSDQHPWFVESRQDRTNPKADWYVWSDTGLRWPEARIVFLDTERSNWTWDEQRGQYYWHRFFSHQPDLNFDNPAVCDAVLEVVRFWLDLGLDGFRLDAVPYLFERDGTNGENLPETHEFLKRLRKEVESSHPQAVLLAEANQRPAELLEYFGSGDECHMCFHFPLMPQLFRALAEERALPIVDVLLETVAVPAGCQWALFLRNHDELTLEMIDEEQRAALCAVFAPDPRMRCNLGIRRRLAPLLDNDTARTKLLHALLFSLAGSPVLYYGDEIGMGDNIYLGDRDGVRTPMHWTGDRNAGFSQADFAQLYLPPLLDPVFNYQAVNVEAQRRDPSSLLHWVRGMLRLRRERAALFGTGALDLLPVDNPSVLAFVRQLGGQSVLCVFNLSRVAQPVGLGLDRFKGCTPVELGGRVPFPPVARPPYQLSLPGHAFYWFDVLPAEAEPGRSSGQRPALSEAA
jgi:maltose alpha-D-glucosyltransferase/alpha-amylase